MPRTDTEIPHIAFTHHRIGVHSAETLAAAASHGSAGPRLLDLQSMDDESQREPRDKQRNLGLAYLGYSLHESNPESASSYRKRAWDLIEDLHARGLDDAETLGALARLAYASSDPSAALRFAGEALDYRDLAPKTRVNCLFFFAQLGVRANHLGPAEQALRQLLAMRRLSEDWLLMGLARQQEGKIDDAQRSLERAVQIAPFRPELRERLAQIYEQEGKLSAVERERAIARKLMGAVGAKRGAQ